LGEWSVRQVSVTSSFKLLACAATLLLGSTRADAQDATWLASPGSNNFNTGTNWSTGTVPTGIATFGGSNTTTILAGVWRNPTTVDAFRFGPGAPTYTFYLGLSNPPSVLNFTGAGIINNSSNAPIFPMGAAF
jgi:hypothetical protein